MNTFLTVKKHSSNQKNGLQQWSPLIERAVYDLMREEDSKVKWHVLMAIPLRIVIKFQYTVYKTLKSHEN